MPALRDGRRDAPPRRSRALDVLLPALSGRGELKAFEHRGDDAVAPRAVERRSTSSRSTRRPAAIAVFAFAVVVFTFMGVKLGLTGEGLHTYGAG